MTECNYNKFDTDSSNQIIGCSQATADMVSFTLQEIMMVYNHTCNKTYTSMPATQYIKLMQQQNYRHPLTHRYVSCLK